jgi:RNA polymerase sigma-70 factor (ECF subfamily)
VNDADRLLLDRVRRGDESAYRELVRAHGRRLLRAAEGLGHPPDEAEDLAQEAFLALVRNAGRLEGEATVFTWLYRVMFNRHVDLVRARERRRVAARAEEAVPEGPDAEGAGRVRAALARLPERDRRLLTLRYFEGLSYEEIAGVLDVPLGTAHSAVYYALEKLRPLLEEKP